ncbi:hypothetical protein ACLQ28_34510, partial [Micromonospora sp. DT201]|uniref:hypothetical protein n=1 Tax=Micromonospora sp. DT201 TaxID=3393442 RepID=UPI003CE718C7
MGRSDDAYRLSREELAARVEALRLFGELPESVGAGAAVGGSGSDELSVWLELRSGGVGLSAVERAILTGEGVGAGVRPQEAAEIVLVLRRRGWSESLSGAEARILAGYGLGRGVPLKRREEVVVTLRKRAQSAEAELGRLRERFG